MVAVPAVLKVAGIGPVTVLAEAVVLAVTAGVRVDVALAQLLINSIEKTYTNQLI